MGIQETTENKTDKFSLLWIAFRSPSVCGWVFGEDNQQVNSEFSEKKKTKKQKKQKTKPDDEIVTWQEIGGGKFSSRGWNFG